jgi:phosphoglycerate dehydrogenase-like enzyme
MSETPTNVTVVTTEPLPEAETAPQKVPFYKNPKIIKTAGIVAATAAATALIVRKVSKNDSDESAPAEDNSSDEVTYVIED